MKKVYKIDNITCSHCAQVTETLVKSIDGVSNSVASFKLQKLTVTLDDDKEAQVDARISEILANPKYCSNCPNR